MNVFVLCTGRCGSVTFAKACSYMTNFTSAHESRTFLLGGDRLAYPDQHIEVDNRLSWFLGRLDRAYGDRAFYVHLRRDAASVARSYRERYGIWIMKAYREGILLNLPANADPLAVCLDYCDTVNSNIEFFLRDKTHTMTIDLAEIENRLSAILALDWCRRKPRGCLGMFSDAAQCLAFYSSHHDR
ncbi:hypothetical protein [Parathermosynechococcus lividus]|nr:hypothetical protein [Thermostichus lividus]